MTHGRSCDMEIITTLGSSYFHVLLTTVRHLLNVAENKFPQVKKFTV